MNTQDILEKMQILFELTKQIEEDVWDDVPEEISKTIDQDQSLHYPQTERDVKINILYEFIKSETENSMFPILDKLTVDDLYDICN
jgi:hypothetical protein